jgi:methionyl-tRNA formyltransferase
MRMDAGLDTGPVYAQRSTPIAPSETTPQLTARLARMGADLLVEVLAGLERGGLAAHPQDDAGATLAPRLRREDGRVDWSATGAAEVDRRVRALDPWPGVTAPLGGAEVRLLTGAPVPDADGGGPPGTVLRTDREGAEVATADGVYAVRRVQPPGRRPMDAAAYLRGRRPAAGTP